MIELNFLWMALLGGLGVAAVAAPFGTIIVWRRMGYFGETLAHAALLGTSIAFLLEWSLQWSVLFICAVFAIVLSFLQQEKNLTNDTWLGIFAQSTLALGLVVMTYLQGIRVDLLGYLFGDILALNIQDLIWIYVGGGFVLLVLFFIWRPLISLIVDEELAQVEGVAVRKILAAVTVLLALVIAIAMKIVGILLITALMIIPAASARQFAQTPESMALLAILLGVFSVFLGMLLSFYLDIPTGPSIVVASTFIFIISYTLSIFTTVHKYKKV